MPARIINTPGTTPIAKVTAIARELEGVVASWGYRLTLFYGSTTWPDHSNRRCLDINTSLAEKVLEGGKTRKLSVDEQIWLGTRIRDYLVTQVKRLGITGIIWNRKVTGFPPGAYRGPYGVERPYSGASAHRDHVHIEVAAGPFAALRPPTKLKVAPGQTVQGYDSKTGKSKGPKYLRKAGRVLSGTLVKAHGDGVYLRTIYGTDYPADSGDFIGRPAKKD